jgi:hypothetical protein
VIDPALLPFFLPLLLPAIAIAFLYLLSLVVPPRD